jgi:hypothetical protein
MRHYSRVNNGAQGARRRKEPRGGLRSDCGAVFNIE